MAELQVPHHLLWPPQARRPSIAKEGTGIRIDHMFRCRPAPGQIRPNGLAAKSIRCEPNAPLGFRETAGHLACLGLCTGGPWHSLSLSASDAEYSAFLRISAADRVIHWLPCMI